MSYGCTGPDFLVCSKPCRTLSSVLQATTPNHLIMFDTNLPKTAFSLQTPSACSGTRAKTAIKSSNNLYPTAEASENFYGLLGVSEAATLTKIKQAYKKLVLKYHPDVSPPGYAEEFTRMFIRIQEAYETLSDPCSRALYDGNLTVPAQNLRRPHQSGLDMNGDWKSRWEAQLRGLETKCKTKNSKDRKSWAARVRVQRSESRMQ